ncbi:Aste57867_20733 [Aphanomyces stellatus]|uniref:Aste57867_20733 protein n=1 Tax=Aphanomyces stellatus TaxID=120398 RepID=A0A485LKD9_9STRA|nr:hypothetical protein As57867_020665 [Aphanomyces stellatus]VFT97413.1 Aste57867_20733 [Aphanomyces stellatus]
MLCRAAAAAFVFLFPGLLLADEYSFSNNVYVGPSASQLVSDDSAFDGPKISPGVNASSYQWWYFDAVSSDGLTSVVLTFFTTPPSAFPLLDATKGPLNVYYWIRFANGTRVSHELNASSALITTDGDGSAGTFYGAGGAWSSCPAMQSYTVELDALDIQGTLTLTSIAAPHYACGPGDAANQSMRFGPNIGWSNAVPDADADAAFTFSDGSELAFSGGSGYHDMNWGNSPWLDNMLAAYWGHARSGPFSIVWSLVLGRDGRNYTTSYVSKMEDGEATTLLTECSLTATVVSPVGGPFPPTLSTGAPQGFDLAFDVGDEGTLHVQIRALNVAAGGASTNNVYFRWTSGAVTSTLGDDGFDDGVAVLEQFALLP